MEAPGLLAARSIPSRALAKQGSLYSRVKPAHIGRSRLQLCRPASITAIALPRRHVLARAESRGQARLQRDTFTNKAWEALLEAPKVADENNNQVVDTVHLLVTLLQQPNGLARRLVQKAGGDPSEMLGYAMDSIRKLPKVTGEYEQLLGNNLSNMLNASTEVMQQWSDKYVSVEHFMLQLVEDEVFGKQAFASQGVTKDKLTEVVKEVRGGSTVEDRNPDNRYEALSKYARDLTQAARDGKLDPVIGRDDEIRRAIQILSRRTKNNPVLIGEPGVGKTAVAEGLAQRIVAGDVPQALQGRTLMSLDMGALIAGASYRGEFEDRLKGVIKEVTDSNGRIVLFIDEIHTVVGAGQAKGSMDAANLLKPMLGRGELRCIGATTLDEYRQYIESDKALERRFQQVMVEEPTVEDTISILRGLRERYELHHGVKIADSALVEAAAMSDRYIADRFLPDKAIDLVDEAAAKLKMEITSKPQQLDEIDRKVLQLEMERLSLEKGQTDRGSQERLRQLDMSLEQLKQRQTDLTDVWQQEKTDMEQLQTLREEVDRVNVDIQQAEREYDLNRAAELKYGTLRELQQRLMEVEGALQSSVSSSRLLRDEVTETDISEIISRWTGIPVAKLLESERQKLLALGEELHKRVIGQDEAVDAVADAIQRSRAGLSDPQRPIASLMFLGPTGVGKTELAKALASYLFDTEEAMVRIDMSEYMEKHTVSRLIGAPPGYVGYSEGGQLTEAVRRRPYSVLLFDEVEKAHADVFNILLQILDDGRVTDSQGRTVGFKNTVIILTSNLGSHAILEKAGQPKAEIQDTVMHFVRANFRPEFVNRIDEFIIFEALQREQLKLIVRLQVDRVRRRLAEKKVNLAISDRVEEYLARKGFDPVYGARPVRRLVQREVETALAKAILRGDIAENDGAYITLANDTHGRLVLQINRVDDVEDLAELGIEEAELPVEDELAMEVATGGANGAADSVEWGARSSADMLGFGDGGAQE